MIPKGVTIHIDFYCDSVVEKQIIVIRIENPSVSPLNRLVWLLKLQDYGSIIHWGCVLWLDFGWKREESCTTLAIKLQKNTSFDFSTSNSFAFVIPRRWKYKEGLDRVFIIRASIPQNYIVYLTFLHFSNIEKKIYYERPMFDRIMFHTRQSWLLFRLWNTVWGLLHNSWVLEKRLGCLNRISEK